MAVIVAVILSHAVDLAVYMRLKWYTMMLMVRANTIPTSEFSNAAEWKPLEAAAESAIRFKYIKPSNALT